MMAIFKHKVKHSTDRAKHISLMCNFMFSLYSVLDSPLSVKGCAAVSVFLMSQPYMVFWGCVNRRLTSRCSSVKITGSATNTRLDSLVIEADRMWELTVSERLCLFMSPSPLSVAFSVLRN